MEDIVGFTFAQLHTLEENQCMKNSKIAHCLEMLLKRLL